MTSTSDIRILIVEDEALIAEDLNSLLSHEGFTVAGVAHNGTDAFDMLASRAPNFAILDINLGNGISGFDIAEVIHTKYKTPYIFLTSFDDEATLEQAHQFAPYGYIVKPFQERTLLTTIKLAIATYDKVSHSGDITKDKIETSFDCNITTQEFNIITELHKGKSYKQISEDLHISQNTLKYHVKNIYNKLDISGRSELVSKLV